MDQNFELIGFDGIHYYEFEQFWNTLNVFQREYLIKVYKGSFDVGIFNLISFLQSQGTYFNDDNFKYLVNLHRMFMK